MKEIGLEYVQKKCQEFAAKVGEEISIPIQVSKRLKNTYGQVHIEGESIENCYPCKIEFSKLLLDTCTLDFIDEVIAHEMAHYLVTLQTGKSHDHDNMFKEMCNKLGFPKAASASAEAELREGVTQEDVYKYTLYCKNCGKFVGGYYRKCKVVNGLLAGKMPIISGCCKKDIELKGNF